MPRRLNTLLRTPDELLVRLEELVRSRSGGDPFEPLFGLLIARLHAQRTGTRFSPSETAAATANDIRSLLRAAAKALPGLLEPPYDTCLPNEALHECVRVLAGFELSPDTLPVLDALLERASAPGAKGNKGQYFTPRNVTALCATLLDPAPGERVADPACGSGGFLLAALAHARRRGGAPALYGYDFDPRAVRIARALLLFAGDAPAHIELADSLARQGEVPDGGFDVILTNPPFAGDVLDRTVLAGYRTADGAARMERDVLFLERCIELLAPGGRLAIVLPHNKLGAARWAPLREWLMNRVQVLAVIGLDRNTFLPHTHQKAGVLLARRPRLDERLPKEQRILFAVSEKSGKDTRGRSLGDDDFSDITHAWRSFVAGGLGAGSTVSGGG